MSKAVYALALALILLVATAYAQTTPQPTTTQTAASGSSGNKDIFNTKKAEEMVQGGVSGVRFGFRLAFLVSIGWMAFIIVKNVVFEQSGIPGVFRDRVFWIPFTLFAVLIGFWAAAQFSGPVQAIYEQWVGKDCPLYWCP